MKKVITIILMLFLFTGCGSEEISTVECTLNETDMLEVGGRTITTIEARDDEIFRFTVEINYLAEDYLEIAEGESLDEVVALLKQFASLSSIEGYTMEITTRGEYIVLVTIVDFDVLRAGEFAEAIDFGEDVSLSVIVSEYESHGATCVVK